ncbi:MAG TPA: hypothetical protein DCL38_06225 [Lachnospiraceae bacterium]|nr:hypothetical protein [Lachnospiraceae bacterium]
MPAGLAAAVFWAGAPFCDVDLTEALFAAALFKAVFLAAPPAFGAEAPADALFTVVLVVLLAVAAFIA